MATAKETTDDTQLSQLKELAGEHAEDDRVIALMMRLATVGIDLSSAGSGIKSESDTSPAGPKASVNERLAGQHAQVDGAVNKVVLTYKVAAVSFTLFYLFCLWRLVRFYVEGYPVTESISPTFRISMGLIIAAVYFVSVIAARTHGKWNAGIEPVGLIAVFTMFFINAGSPDIAYPGFIAVWFLLYTLLRKDNRKRTIVVLIALLVCFIGLGLAAFQGSVLHNALWSGLAVGVLSAILIRFVDTYRSGTVVLSGDWLKKWRTYEDVQHELKTFDVILESENKYAPSRITSLFSRSAWTHAAMIVREPSDKVKNVYGVESREELASRARIVRSKLIEPDLGAEERRAGFAELDRILDAMEETLYVFEAVRPVVALTPLKEWMQAKQTHMPHKVIVCRRFQEYEGAARVLWNHEALEDFMLEVQGLPFTLDANNMIRANYQLNKTRYQDSIFCSELVAEAYQRAGIFTKNRLSSNYTPNDFSSLVPTKFLLSSSLASEFWLREVEHTEDGNDSST